MQLSIIGKDNQSKGKQALPAQFDEPVREDLIKRAVLALQSNARQKYGAHPEAGKRPSVRISKRRHDYRGTYGIGQSRTPRKVMSVRGTRFNWTGAFAPQTVGGRRAHAPKADKAWEHKINDKERKKAIRSALAATITKECVEARGHKAPSNYPFIISNEFQDVKKTAELKGALEKLGLKEELARSSEKHVRPGKGKMRGRKYKQAVSLLIVTAKDCALTKAAENVPGVNTITAEEINAEYLAPGAAPGRLTLYTEDAIKTISEEQLFTEQRKKPAKKEEKKAKKTTKKVAEKKPATPKKKEAKPEQKPETPKPESGTPKAAAKPEVSA